jgi:hypothetical protein
MSSSQSRVQLLILLIFLVCVPTAASWSYWRKIAKSDVPYSTIGRRDTVEEASAACKADPRCKAYNSDGELKSCAGCEGGSNCCVYPAGAQDFPAADRIDLFVKNGAAPPVEWADALSAGSLLYSQPEPDICMMPEVGNGFLASIVGFSSLHVSGFFNGGCGGVTKAHLPSVIGITATNANVTLTQAALDTQAAVYLRRLHIENSSAVVEQRTFAHRVHKHIMVTEFELISGADEVTLVLDSLFDPLCGPPPPPPIPPPPPPGPVFNGTYLHVSGDSGVNGHDVGSLPQCASGKCPIEEIKAACDKLKSCDLFQTHGFLKRCATPGTKTNSSTACNTRTPWTGVDSYYKIRTAFESETNGQETNGQETNGHLTTGAQHISQRAADEQRSTHPTEASRFGEGQACGTTGNGCAGRFSHDVVFDMLKAPAELAVANVTVFRGNTTRKNESGSRDTAVIVSRAVPTSLRLRAGKQHVERFIAAVTTTVAMPATYDPVQVQSINSTAY